MNHDHPGLVAESQLTNDGRLRIFLHGHTDNDELLGLSQGWVRIVYINPSDVISIRQWGTSMSVEYQTDHSEHEEEIGPFDTEDAAVEFAALVANQVAVLATPAQRGTT